MRADSFEEAIWNSLSPRRGRTFARFVTRPEDGWKRIAWFDGGIGNSLSKPDQPSPCNPAPAHHGVLVIKNTRLSWRDGALGDVQLHPGAALGRRNDRGRCPGMIVADSGRDFERGRRCVEGN